MLENALLVHAFDYMFELTVIGWCIIYIMAISNLFPYFLLQSLLPFSNSNFLHILFVYFYRIPAIASGYRYTMQLQSYTLWLVHMNCVNPVQLDLLPSKMLLQSIWPYTERVVSTLAWNNVLQHVPMFNTAVAICSFNCLIALEYCLSNGSNFILCFMTCTLKV